MSAELAGLNCIYTTSPVLVKQNTPYTVC